MPVEGRDARKSKVPVAHHVTREIDQHVPHIVVHSSRRSLVDQLRAASNELVEVRFGALALRFHELDVHVAGRLST